jgi:hypothetical protein
MTMQRRHYEMIAAILANAKPDHAAKTPDAYAQWMVSLDRFATTFKLDNPRFDRDRFIKACGAA